MKIYNKKYNAITRVLIGSIYIISYILMGIIFYTENKVLLGIIYFVGLIAIICQEIDLYKSYVRIEEEKIYIHKKIKDIEIYYKDIILIKYNRFLGLTSITVWCKDYYKTIDCYRENYLDMLYNIVEKSIKCNPIVVFDVKLIKILDKKGYPVTEIVGNEYPSRNCSKLKREWRWWK